MLFRGRRRAGGAGPALRVDERVDELMQFAMARVVVRSVVISIGAALGVACASQALGGGWMHELVVRPLNRNKGHRELGNMVHGPIGLQIKPRDHARQTEDRARPPDRKSTRLNS